MLSRLWFVLASLWAAVFIANGSTKQNGIEQMDVLVASVPFLMAVVVPRVLLFVFTGSATRLRPRR